MDNDTVCHITQEPCEFWEQESEHYGECKAVHPEQCPTDD
jgi:hypothetical protein